MNIRKFAGTITVAVFGILSCGSVFAQNDTIARRVVNPYGQPIKNAKMVSEYGAVQSLSSSEGKFAAKFDDRSTYVTVSAEGYLNQRIPVADLENGKDIELQYDAFKMGGSVSTGYARVSRESMTGAVSSVEGSVLEKSPTNIFSETLYGRLPGLQIQTNLTELTYFGYNNFNKTIRGTSSINGGSPLMIIDGVVCPVQYYEFLQPRDIESVTVLKDASTTAIYGIQGANGAIVVNTKRGYNTKRIVNAYADYSVEQETKRPIFINSAQYATMMNQAADNDNSTSSRYTQEQIDKFAAGDDPAYPNNNWFDMFLKDFFFRQRLGVDVTGGNNVFRYFSNVSFINQDQLFKTYYNDEGNYDPEPNTNLINFRTNMDVRFNRYVSGFLRLTGSVKREKVSAIYPASGKVIDDDDGFGGMWYNGDGTIMPYVNLFYQPPTMFGPITPIYGDESAYPSNQVTSVTGQSNPVYGLLNRSGFGRYIETNVLAQTGLNFDLGFVTPGLSAGGAFSYQTYARNMVATAQDYRVFERVAFPGLDEFYEVNPVRTNSNLKYYEGHVFFYYLNLTGKIDYSRRFGDHSIDAQAHTYYQYRETEADQGAAILPYKLQNSGLSLLYGYKDRYFVKGDIGSSGSEQFAKDRRYVTTPAISGAWIVSKEDFFQDSFFNLLKFRLSYGITANDQFGSNRFLYLDEIYKEGTEYQRGNSYLTAEKIKKLNAGVDLGLARMFYLKADYFANRVDNMLIGANDAPLYQGYPIDYLPKLNEGKMRNSGYELALGFNKQFNKNLNAFAEFNFMHTRNIVEYNREAPRDASYPYSYREDGYTYGQLWGYMVDKSNGNGYFNSAEEIANSGLTYNVGAGNAPRVGDLKYIDMNNDGVIDDKDKVPMGYSSKYPEREYSFVGGVNWGQWEFSLLLQGVSRKSYFLEGMGVYENSGSGVVFSDLHLNAWTPERYAAGQKISFPALTTGTSTNQVNNSFFLQDGSYLRLKNVELAYSLPKNIAKLISSNNIRVALNIQNLFTWDRMKTKEIDPEIAKLTSIQPYRVYNLNLNINF